MSDAQTASVKAADPLEQWRELRDGYMGAWAKAMGEAVNSEAYAKSNGVLLETYLTTSAPFRDAQKKVMLSALEQLHMPSQADFLSLADRLSNLELLVDDMDAKLDQILQLATSAAAKPAPNVETKPTSAAPKQETKPTPATKQETKPNSEVVADVKPAHVVETETKSLFEAKAETKPVLAPKAETRPLFETKAEPKPAPVVKAASKPAPAAKAGVKAATPKKSVVPAKKGSR